jgi:iron complex outermembrane receptor protein
MKSTILRLAACMLLFSVSAFAQQAEITGKVTDSKSGAPLSGATIVNKSTGKTSLSGTDGGYIIAGKKGDAIAVTMTGYGSVTLTVGASAMLAIQLNPSAAVLSDVVMVGTRRSGRMKTETPVPVDVLNVDQMTLSTARTDLTSMMNYAAPSFNYNKQSGSDGADHIDLATLRGLSPDQTLVLVNGKRRHQTAFVAVFGTRGRGSSGTDLSAIPYNAVERVEILRDGASAQYGSDAIAGVINLVLKKNTGIFSGNLGYSAYHDKEFNPYFKKELGQYVYENAFDGNTVNFNSNYGVTLGKRGGYIHFAGNYLSQGKTYRQVLETDASSDKYLPTNIYRRAHGDGSITSGGLFLNMEAPMNDRGTVFYAFGGSNYKSSDAYAFTRNWSARPDRFPTAADGSLIYVPDIMRTTADGDTFFNPHIQTKVSDYSLAAGVRGTFASGWDWDLSNSYGRNDFHFYGDKTFNASLGADKTHFDDGGFNYAMNTTNLVVSKNLCADLFTAFGAEYRTENYNLYAGEEGSYKNYDPNGDKATGSQGFPGYQPSDVVKAKRNVISAYANAEWKVSKSFSMDAALRYGSFSDFGETWNSKLAGLLKVGDHFSFRGSVSNGFRAPSLAQINFSSTFTTVQGGEIAEVKIAPNTSAITRAAGIPELKQERSLNTSLGFICNPLPSLNISVDAYRIRIWDRVVLSGQFSADDNTLDPALTALMQNLKVSYAQFFANAVNTTNMGIDFVADYNKKLSGGKYIKGVFSGNFQRMDINNINVPGKLNNTEDHRKGFFSDREQAFLLASAPKTKFALTAEYGTSKWSVGTRVTYFGKVNLLGYGEDGLGINPQVPTDADENVYVPDSYFYGGKYVTDVYVTYRVTKSLQLSAGADNLLNVHPDLGVNPLARGWAFNNETGGPWDAVQMGGNGTRIFARIGFHF